MPVWEKGSECCRESHYLKEESIGHISSRTGYERFNHGLQRVLLLKMKHKLIKSWKFKKYLFERICRHITRQNLFSNVTSFISINVHYCQVCGTFQILTRTSPELLYTLCTIKFVCHYFVVVFSDVNFVFNPTIPFYTFNFWIHNKNITTKAEEIQVQTLYFMRMFL